MMVMILLALGCESVVVEEVVLSLQGLTQQKHISPNQPLQWNTTPMPTQNVEINIYINVVFGKQKWFVNSWLKVYDILNFLNINIYTYSHIIPVDKIVGEQHPKQTIRPPWRQYPNALAVSAGWDSSSRTRRACELELKQVARVLWKRRARDVEILGATLAPPTPPQSSIHPQLPLVHHTGVQSQQSRDHSPDPLYKDPKCKRADRTRISSCF